MRKTIVTTATLTLRQSLLARLYAGFRRQRAMDVQRPLVAEMILEVPDGLEPRIRLVESDGEPVIIFEPGDTLPRTLEVVNITIRERGSSRYYLPRIRPSMTSKTVLEFVEPPKVEVLPALEPEPVIMGLDLAAGPDRAVLTLDGQIVGKAATLFIGDGADPEVFHPYDGGTLRDGANARLEQGPGEIIAEGKVTHSGFEVASHGEAAVHFTGGKVAGRGRHLIGERGSEVFMPMGARPGGPFDLFAEAEAPDHVAELRAMAVEVEAQRDRYQTMSENTASAARKAAYALRSREYGNRAVALRLAITRSLRHESNAERVLQELATHASRSAHGDRAAFPE